VPDYGCNNNAVNERRENNIILDYLVVTSSKQFRARQRIQNCLVFVLNSVNSCVHIDAITHTLS